MLLMHSQNARSFGKLPFRIQISFLNSVRPSWLPPLAGFKLRVHLNLFVDGFYHQKNCYETLKRWNKFVIFQLVMEKSCELLQHILDVKIIIIFVHSTIFLTLKISLWWLQTTFRFACLNIFTFI